mgnify:CR=1 FL=1
MKMSARDQLLATLLPGMVVMTMGVYLCISTLNERHRLEGTLEKARAEALRSSSTPPPPSDDAKKLALAAAKTQDAAKKIEQLESRIAGMQADMVSLETRVRELQVAWSKSTAFLHAAAERNERIRKLNLLLMRHGVSFIEDSDAETQTVSPAMTALAQRIEQNGAARPRLRVVRCYATFLSMHDALQEIGREEALALPVGLTMKKTEDPDRQEWTLLLWI